MFGWHTYEIKRTQVLSINMDKKRTERLNKRGMDCGKKDDMCLKAKSYADAEDGKRHSTPKPNKSG